MSARWQVTLRDPIMACEFLQRCGDLVNCYIRVTYFTYFYQFRKFGENRSGRC